MRRSRGLTGSRSSLVQVLEVQINAAGLLAGMVREFRFHPSRKWRFDFAWPPRAVALEFEGGVYVNGAHTRGAHFESDAEKYNEAALLGWRVLRVTGGMVASGVALKFLERALGRT